MATLNDGGQRERSVEEEAAPLLADVDDLMNLYGGEEDEDAYGRGKWESKEVVHSTEPPLIRSLFTLVSPYINFVSEGRVTKRLHRKYHKRLTWCTDAGTPRVVRNCVLRSGFRPAAKGSRRWMGCWGRCRRVRKFRGMKYFQKYNHFPGSHLLGRKDKLGSIMMMMRKRYGAEEFGFFPDTFDIPADIKLLLKAWKKDGPQERWIVKPPASSNGRGIRVISNWSQVPQNKAKIVQRYINRPYLIDGTKFDLRVYVYVGCYHPLRIYVYEDGLTRFATREYSYSVNDEGDRFMHLTNYSLNKKSAHYIPNEDPTKCQGHKWSLKSLWAYLELQGKNTLRIRCDINDAIIKTIIASESSISRCIKANVESRHSVHELFGFDIILDENLKPFILEVNTSPSLHTDGILDLAVKGELIKDMQNLAGYRIPDATVSGSYPSQELNRDPNCLDRRLLTDTLAGDEKEKHAWYCQKANDEEAMGTIGDVLTPDDLRVLVESIDEDSHKGGFQRIFPTPFTHKYLKFFEAPRYYNLLLDKLGRHFCGSGKRKGIALIESYCRSGIHLQNPANHSKYQWTPPVLTLTGVRL